MLRVLASYPHLHSQAALLVYLTTLAYALVTCDLSYSGQRNKHVVMILSFLAYN